MSRILKRARSESLAGDIVSHFVDALTFVLILACAGLVLAL